MPESKLQEMMFFEEHRELLCLGEELALAVGREMFRKDLDFARALIRVTRDPHMSQLWSDYKRRSTSQSCE